MTGFVNVVVGMLKVPAETVRPFSNSGAVLTTVRVPDAPCSVVGQFIVNEDVDENVTGLVKVNVGRLTGPDTDRPEENTDSAALDATVREEDEPVTVTEFENEAAEVTNKLPAIVTTPLN